jgi:hypothetical protein
LRNCFRSPKHKICFAIWLFAGTFPGSAIATTVVAVVTPSGIVIGADGKGTESKAQKIFLLNGHLLIAGLGLEHVNSKDTGRTLYDFPTWVNQIRKNVNSKMSIEGLVPIVENEARTALAFMRNDIESGKLTKDQAIKYRIDPVTVEYVIGGYEGAIPRVIAITLKPDWQAKTLAGPSREPVDPTKEGDSVDSYICWFGRHSAIEKSAIADSEEQKEFAARVPVELAAIVAKHHLTLNQASNVVRAFLGMQSKAEQEFVGFPMTVVTIPKSGNGWVRVYKEDAVVLSQPPEGKAGR